MSRSSSATPLEPPDSFLRQHNTMKFLESRTCPKVQGHLGNNLPLLHSQDLKKGILGCQQDLQLKLLLRDVI